MIFSNMSHPTFRAVLHTGTSHVFMCLSFLTYHILSSIWLYHCVQDEMVYCKIDAVAASGSNISSGRNMSGLFFHSCSS